MEEEEEEEEEEHSIMLSCFCRQGSGRPSSSSGGGNGAEDCVLSVARDETNAQTNVSNPNRHNFSKEGQKPTREIRKYQDKTKIANPLTEASLRPKECPTERPLKWGCSRESP